MGAANPDLQERELVKLARLADALAHALRQRGVKEPGATLAAETGIVLFRVAFDRWANEKNERGLASLVQEALEELRAELVSAKGACCRQRPLSCSTWIL